MLSRNPDCIPVAEPDASGRSSCSGKGARLGGSHIKRSLRELSGVSLSSYNGANAFILCC